MLNTAKLSPERDSRVRDALSALPAQLFSPNDSKFLIVDSGCSDIATGDKRYLVPKTIEALETPKPMDGIGGALQATHKGNFRYEVLGDDGSVIPLKGTEYYVPGLPCRLFSLQDYFRQKHEAGLSGYKMTYLWSGSRLELGPIATVSLTHDQATRLPKLRCFTNVMETAESMAMTCVTDEYNQNLTLLQKALLQ